MKKGLFLLFLILFFCLFLPLDVKAQPCQNIVPCGGPGQPVCTLCHLFEMLVRIVNCVLLTILPALAILMLVIGGAMFIIAQFSGAEILPGGTKGGPALLSQAKRLITAVIVGLVIIYTSWLIIGVFLQISGVADWTELQIWQRGFFEIICEEPRPRPS